MLAADRLSGPKLRAGLGHATIGREIIVLDETTSTNDVVLQMANGGAPEGLVVFAEHQTGGRGQRGNIWESAAGKGLLCSVLLRPNVALQDSARLVDWAVKGIAWTLESTCLRKVILMDAKSPGCWWKCAPNPVRRISPLRVLAST